MSKPLLTANDIADLLALDSPTDEQQRVIEAPLDGVYRVIAGAGSGKTETMAQRVLYLVANGLVEPRNVVGLTFTKKASGELAKRLAERLQLLSDRVPEVSAPDPFDRPRVHTYNAFATRLFSDYAVYLGIDGDVQVASAATAWGIARDVVKNSRDTRLADLGVGVDRIATMVLKLSQSLGENEVQRDDLVALVQHVQSLGELPNGSRFAYAIVDEHIDTVSALLPLWDLVEEFSARKRERGIVEFSDQVRFALDVIRRAPEVVDTLRETYQVVLLDEYQDTSVLQAKLLSTLFADHPVMAVGDPHQAIYGWRGASAGNLRDFPHQFASHNPATTFTLSVSWRNSVAVLDAANRIAEPLTRLDPDGVVTLTPPDNCAPGLLTVAFPETIREEAEALAEWFANRLAEPGDKKPTAAMLLRNRSHQNLFVDALKQRDIPVHVLGIGGLLSDPVVADMVCGVAVVHRPEANSELVRLLAGGLFRVGAADLYALSGVAIRLSKYQVKPAAHAEEPDGDDDAPSVAAPPLSLGEALERLRVIPEDDALWREFSPEGRVRLRRAAQLIHSRRRFRHDDLIDQLVGWEKASLLDIEHRANSSREDSDRARSALFDAAASYVASSDEPTVGGFLDWLHEAEWRDNLQPRSDKAEEGCVQVLTIHGAKGLEWDFVALPRLVDGELPGKPREGTRGWIQRGELPYPLRGDRDHLPQLQLHGLETRKDLRDAADQFFADVAAHHHTEERRLAYVAITRAKKEVGLFGSWWAHQTKPRPPSVFLRELADTGHIPELPHESQFEENPAPVARDETVWPGDPLGQRREASEEAAAAVTSWHNREAEALDPQAIRDLDGVLARSRPAPRPRPDIPTRISASLFSALLADADAAMAARARPLPREIRDAEQSGTAFHEWVEQHYRNTGQLLLGGDWDIDDGGDDNPEDDNEAWREAFLASDFASRPPLAIEREIYLPLGNRIIVCKIDAVFATDDGADIIDWKTGRLPSSPEDEARRSLQLSLYRLAWARWTDTPVDAVTAGWWFARTGEVRRPSTLFDKDTLSQKLDSAIADYQAGSPPERA